MIQRAAKRVSHGRYIDVWIPDQNQKADGMAAHEDRPVVGGEDCRSEIAAAEAIRSQLQLAPERRPERGQCLYRRLWRQGGGDHEPIRSHHEPAPNTVEPRQVRENFSECDGP
jgi:hypothetical protein